MKHRRFPFLALAVLPLLLAGCEQKPAAPPPAAPAAAPDAPAAAPKAAVEGARMVGFELTEPPPVGALQYDVQYAGEGRFVGDADAVACETKIEGALSSYNHIVDQKMLRAAFVSVKGFGGPIRVSQCQFQGNVKVEDFTITVRDSSSPDLTPLDPAPSIKVVID
ncbi:MAG: hypothetical protein ABR587_03895 [Candidatus Binatia bacterium]